MKTFLWFVVMLKVVLWSNLVLPPGRCSCSLVTSDLMQEQPTLEMVSAGSDTHDTSSLKRSFSIRLISDS